MTNTLKALEDLAKEAGFRILSAKVLVDNNKSKGVLERAGFNEREKREGESDLYDEYYKTIS
jgi:RimJ/RimL family protein N-acetyltransferase